MVECQTRCPDATRWGPSGERQRSEQITRRYAVDFGQHLDTPIFLRDDELTIEGYVDAGEKLTRLGLFAEEYQPGWVGHGYPRRNLLLYACIVHGENL